MNPPPPPDPTPPAHPDPTPPAHHADPLAAYLAVYAALLILLLLTVGAAFIHLGPITIVVAMVIASIKAALVALIFMHLRAAGPLTRLFAAAGLCWLAVLFSLTLTDYVSRGWLPFTRGWTDRPIVPPPPGAPRPPPPPEAPPPAPPLSSAGAAPPPTSPPGSSPPPPR